MTGLSIYVTFTPDLPTVQLELRGRLGENHRERDRALMLHVRWWEVSLMWWDEALNSNKLSEKETTGNYQDGNMETTAWRADWDRKSVSVSSSLG